MNFLSYFALVLLFGLSIGGVRPVVGIVGEWSGKLLWLAAAVHAVLTILLVFAWFKERKSRKTDM